MIRSLAVRNLLSVVLLAVSVAGIAVQIGLVREGRVQALTRVTLAAYALIAIYAAASIAVRFSAARKPAAKPASPAGAAPPASAVRTRKRAKRR